MSEPTIVVELIKTPPGLRRFPGQKPMQPYRFMVSDAGNHEPLERSSERYRHEESALDAIEQVHAPEATVLLRRSGHPDRVLRYGMRQVDSIGPADRGSLWFGLRNGHLYRWQRTAGDVVDFGRWLHLNPYMPSSGWQPSSAATTIPGPFQELRTLTDSEAPA
jgi:uncharacterized protein YegP (UPF0339 family)